MVARFKEVEVIVPWAVYDEVLEAARERNRELLADTREQAARARLAAFQAQDLSIQTIEATQRILLTINPMTT